VLAAVLIILTTGYLDIGRAFNYPAVFPKDAIDTGWTVRHLQESGIISDKAKILIERRADWGDLGIVAIANRPERFVLMNELAYRQLAFQALPHRKGNGQRLAIPDNDSVRGTICDHGFQMEACRNSILRDKFSLVILSSPERVQSFENAFSVRSWILGGYHVFDMNLLSPAT